jgi:hypothetical protein
MMGTPSFRARICAPNEDQSSSTASPVTGSAPASTRVAEYFFRLYSCAIVSSSMLSWWKRSLPRMFVNAA